MTGDVEYFGRRALEEKQAAGIAGDPRAREAHLEMAERYSELARAIAGHELVLGTRSGADAFS